MKTEILKKEITKMKSLTMNLLLAAAMCLTASVAASAAEIRFEIPFAFQAAGMAMAPGTYAVRPASGEVHFQLLNTVTGKSVYLHSIADHDTQKDWKAAAGGVLAFACNEGACALTELWTHSGYPTHKVANPRVSEGGTTHVALIRAASSGSK